MPPKRKRDEIDEESIKRICQSINNKFAKAEDALAHIKSLFDNKQFRNGFPSILWKHQCYPLMKNRSNVDMELSKLCKEGTIRFFKLGTTMRDHETAVVFIKDYIDYIQSLEKSQLVDKFVEKVLTQNSSTSYTSEELKSEYGFNEEQIKHLVHLGILAIHRSVGNWLLSIPSCGSYYKAFINGRKALENSIKRTRYNEIATNELLSRKPPKDVKLSMAYHILDLIGADLVQCIESPAGTLLRLL